MLGDEIRTIILYPYLTPSPTDSHSAKPEFTNDYGVIQRPAAPLPTFFNSEVIDVLYYMEVTAGMKISVTAVCKYRLSVSC